MAKYVLREGAVRIVWPECEVNDTWAEEHDCLVVLESAGLLIRRQALRAAENTIVCCMIDTKNVKKNWEKHGRC